MEKAEAEYYLLSSSEKAHHKAELNRMRKKYQDARKEFFSFESAIEKEKPSVNDEDQTEREDLLNDFDELKR